MFCGNCGNTMREGDRFCAKCGTSVRSFIPAAPDQYGVPAVRSRPGAPAVPIGYGMPAVQPGYAAAPIEYPAQPKPKRQSFLGVFSFILSLYGAYSAFMVILIFSGNGPFSRAGANFGGMVTAAGVFYCSVTTILAFSSLLLKDRKKGLGAAALTMSLISLALMVTKAFFA